MKKLLVAVCVAIALPALAQEELTEPTAGDYAAVAARGNPLQTPPGIYAYIAQSADAWFSQSPFAPTVWADDLLASLQRCDPVVVIDVRDALSYKAGHIPGAVNIPLATLFEPANLTRLPTDGTRIVTSCVTGHTGSMAASVLATLGYNAATVRFGWLGWNGGKMKFFSASNDAGTIVKGLSSMFVDAKPVAYGAEPGGYCAP